MLKPESLAKWSERIVSAARAMMADPNNMEIRGEYVRAAFNHDITAQVIVSLAGEQEPTREAAPSGWRPIWEPQEAGRKFIALYDDGSGARLFYRFDGGVIECEGETYWGDDADLALDNSSLWAYLPSAYAFWCENAEDPVILPSSAKQVVVEKSRDEYSSFPQPEGRERS